MDLARCLWVSDRFGAHGDRLTACGRVAYVIYSDADRPGWDATVSLGFDARGDLPTTIFAVRYC